MTLAPDPAEITPPHRADAYARRRGLGLWTVLAMCLFSVALGVGLAATAPWWWPSKDKAAHPAPIFHAPEGSTPASTDMPVVAEPQDPAETSGIGVEARLQALEAGQDRTAQAAAAALAAALLAEAASSSRPFDKELAALEKVLPLSPDALALRTLAQRGAPTRSALAAGFDDAASAASLAARDPGEGAGVFDRLGYMLASIVTIRRVGSTVGGTPDAILARAEHQVDEGDIDGALTTLDALPTASRRAMSEWRAGAERRAAIDRRVTSLRATALVNLAQASGSAA